MRRPPRLVVAASLVLAPLASLAQVAPLQAPSATAAGSTGITVRPGLEAFAQYGLRLTNTDAGTDAVHDFDVPRTHASLSASYEHVRARAVLEAVRSASEGSLLGVGGDSLILRLREAWGGWQSPRVDVRAGVTPTLTLPEIESTWGLRAVAPTPLEATRLASPADLGVTARVALPGGYGAVAVGAFNGEGYAQREFNRSKSVEAMAVVRPLPGGALGPLCVLASYLLGTSGAGDVRADRATAAVLWRGARVRGGLSFTYAWGVEDRGDRRGWLAEGFVAAEPIGALLLGARVLRWRRDADVDTDHVTTVVATAGWRVARPWEVFLAGTRSITGRARLPGDARVGLLGPARRVAAGLLTHPRRTNRMKPLSLSLCLALLVGACSEQRLDAIVIADAAVDVPTSPTPMDAGVPTAADVPAVDAPPTPDAGAGGGLVINEIRAVGEEWVELFNAGASPVDLSNVRVTDTETDDGGPRVSRAMRFPAGTMLSPGQYVVVVSDQADAGSGPQTRCPDGGPTTCFHAGWSLSASRGETVWVLSPSGAVTARALYPMEAAPDGGAWGRLPNGAGPFAVVRPTPGAANVGP